MNAAVQSLNAPVAKLSELKIPPCSVEAEQSLIAAVVSNNKVLFDVDRLTDEDFFRHEHILIWREIQAMAAQNLPVDAVTLISSLDKKGELDSVGGADYIVDIITNGRGSSNAQHYANIIRDRSVSRKLIRAAYEIADIGYGSGEAQTKIDKAQSLTASVELLESSEPKHINDILQRAIAKIDMRFKHKGEIIGLSTGFADLDRAICGLEKGDMMILAGRPSMGKTTLAMNIAENVMLDGKFVIVFSLEMPENQLADRMLSSIGGIPHERIRTGKLLDEEWPHLTSAASRMKDKNIYIDDDSVLTSNQVLSRVRKIASKKGQAPDLIVLDYMQLLSDEGDGTARITKISRNLKLVARAMNCPFIVLSQLNRGPENRPNKRPVMSDLRESGAIEQDADIIIMAYRDEVYNENSPQKGVAEAIIRKQRNGPLKTIFMQSQLHMSRFRTLANYIPPSDPVPQKGRRYEGYDD